jgi:hypothetical protein
MEPCGEVHLRAEGHAATKEVNFVYRILVFHFFYKKIWLMVQYDVTFNVTTTI